MPDTGTRDTMPDAGITESPIVPRAVVVEGVEPEIKQGRGPIIAGNQSPEREDLLLPKQETSVCEEPTPANHAIPTASCSPPPTEDQRATRCLALVSGSPATAKEETAALLFTDSKTDLPEVPAAKTPVTVKIARAQSSDYNPTDPRRTSSACPRAVPTSGRHPPA